MNKFDVVIFDLDSTLVKIEGLDWLAEKAGKAEAVKPLTKQSMNGKLDFHEAMRRKMRAIAPSHADVVALGEQYCTNLVDDAKDVITALHFLKKKVWLLTGNFRPAVEIFSRFIGIPDERVICNEIFVDENGTYLGFDEGNPLSRNSGKRIMIERVIQNKRLKTVLIGDGMTDLACKKAVDLFIGYGGVVQRENVKINSRAYVTHKSLSMLLLLILHDDELEIVRQSEFRDLLLKAERLISRQTITASPH